MARIIAWVLVVICLILAAYASIERSQINKQQAAKVAVVHDTITKDSAVYVHDTTTVRRVSTVYRSARASVIVASEQGRLAPDTVLRFVRVADTALSADSTALSDCNRLLQAKDTLFAVSTRQPLSPPSHRLTYFIEPMYSLTDGTYAVNGGAELRLFGSWSAVANAIVSKQSGVFVGLSKSF